MTTTRFMAVVTAAGHTTRFRPFSAAVPKEMLPIGARPALDLVIDECATAGATEIVVVTRPGDQVVPAHLDAAPRRSVRVDVVEEDLGHGYGNAAPLLTLIEGTARGL